MATIKNFKSHNEKELTRDGFNHNAHLTHITDWNNTQSDCTFRNPKAFAFRSSLVHISPGRKNKYFTTRMGHCDQLSLCFLLSSRFAFVLWCGVLCTRSFSPVCVLDPFFAHDIVWHSASNRHLKMMLPDLVIVFFLMGQRPDLCSLRICRKL